MEEKKIVSLDGADIGDFLHWFGTKENHRSIAIHGEHFISRSGEGLALPTSWRRKSIYSFNWEWDTYFIANDLKTLLTKLERLIKLKEKRRAKAALSKESSSS